MEVTLHRIPKVGFKPNFDFPPCGGLQVVVCMVEVKFLLVVLLMRSICYFLKVHQLHCIYGVTIREWCIHSMNWHYSRKNKTHNLATRMRGSSRMWDDL